MTFDSYTFLIFFLIVVGIHYTRISWRMKKVSLLLGSYAFYAAWNPPFVLLLWISTMVDWIMARKIHEASTDFKRKLFLWISLALNLGMLGYFKYGDFMLKNFQYLCETVGFHYEPPSMSIVLPVGISFYTFQSLSYTLDIYRRKMTPWNSSLDFALFVTFFPQLVAGPIVRAVEFLPQCETERKATAEQIGYGLWLLVLGLFQKVVIADGVFAPIVEDVYKIGIVPDSISAWAGTLAFTGQIYCDFAGYSNCALGAAACLGFQLPENFRSPFAAIGFSDYWQRWHMSLSAWLRDYLYFTLGGSRQGNVRTLVNLTITMFLGGLWHGASWTFVVWGLLNGVLLVAERLLSKLRIAKYKFWQMFPGRITLLAVTFICIVITRVYFRAETFSQSFTMITSMFGMVQSSPELFHLSVSKIVTSFLLMLFLITLHWHLKEENFASYSVRVSQSPWLFRSVAIACMLIVIIMMPGEDRAFIYFQF